MKNLCKVALFCALGIFGLNAIAEAPAAGTAAPGTTVVAPDKDKNAAAKPDAKKEVKEEIKK